MILLVDDHADSSNVLSRLLGRNGYESHSVGGGQATLDYLSTAEIAPQLVILDVAMPGMGGIECLKRMKRSPELKSIPVLMYSADFSQGRMNEALSAGAVDYVVKGTIPWPDLIALVHKHARMTRPASPSDRHFPIGSA